MSWQNCEELKSNAKCSRFGRYFTNVRNTHVCYMKYFMRSFHRVCDIGTNYMTYWYKFFTCCEEMVPILLSAKFTKCEICGSSMTSVGLSWDNTDSMWRSQLKVIGYSHEFHVILYISFTPGRIFIKLWPHAHLSETLCRIHASAIQTPGQGHS